MAAKRFKKVDNATALMWKTIMVAETTFRRLDSAALLKGVYNGITFAEEYEEITTPSERRLSLFTDLLLEAPRFISQGL